MPFLLLSADPLAPLMFSVLGSAFSQVLGSLLPAVEGRMGQPGSRLLTPFPPTPAVLPGAPQGPVVRAMVSRHCPLSPNFPYCFVSQSARGTITKYQTG